MPRRNGCCEIGKSRHQSSGFTWSTDSPSRHFCLIRLSTPPRCPVSKPVPTTPAAVKMPDHHLICFQERSQLDREGGGEVEPRYSDLWMTSHSVWSANVIHLLPVSNEGPARRARSGTAMHIPARYVISDGYPPGFSTSQVGPHRQTNEPHVDEQ